MNTRTAQIPIILLIVLATYNCQLLNDMRDALGNRSSKRNAMASINTTFDEKKEIEETPISSIPPLDPIDLKRPGMSEQKLTPAGNLATDQYIEILKATRYFHLIAKRAHGWPESDNRHPFFAHWWIATQIIKKDGKITYKHHRMGTDNAGIPTSSLLEGICYAYALNRKPNYEHLAHRFIRGYWAWIRAFRRSPEDNLDPILSRVIYPESVFSTDYETPALIDYDDVRPGDDNSATIFVHNSTNPDWGDIWIKNKRSKDDLGYMMRALGIFRATCGSILQSQDVIEDVTRNEIFYRIWARKVISNNYGIATVDKEWKPYVPWETLARFSKLGSIECNARLTLQTFGNLKPANFDCDDGVGLVDSIAAYNDNNEHLLRSYHQSAVVHTRLIKQISGAEKLLYGLANRIEKTLASLEKGSSPTNFDPLNFSHTIIQAANLGVPLKNKEINFLYEKIAESHSRLVLKNPSTTYSVEDRPVPDGTYPFGVRSEGIDFTDLGLLLGQCISPFLHPRAPTTLNCDKIRAYLASDW